ncbi:MAG: superoxide dismutase [Methylophilus sp.]
MNELTNEALLSTKINLKHYLPPLKYDYAALEPYIDTRTMILHHDNHHAGYVKKLNEALESFVDFRNYSALWLLLNLEKIPKEIRAAVHHNAGGHVNHSMFWRTMKPGAAGEPKGLLRAAINRDFGSLADFKKQFEEQGSKLFGSGWVWLTRTRQNGGKLEIITTQGHDHPMMQNRFPLLLNDVWEHAYYLKYENRRADYLKAWWSIVDWEQAARCFERSDSSVEEYLEVEEEHLLPKHHQQ